MADCLLWVGHDRPPETVIEFAERRGWEVRTADPEDAASVAADSRPNAVMFGVIDPDFAQVRGAVPGTVLAYCPSSTTPDGMTGASAAGVDVIFPQDASEWSVDGLDQRLRDTESPGTETPVSIASVAEDGSTAVGTNEDLRREHKRLWTLFENLPDPVVDAEHLEEGPVVRAANDAFAEVFGYQREAILGRPIDDVLSSPAGEDTDGLSSERINERVRRGEVTGAKVRRETENGARTFLFRGIPYAENGTVRAFGIYTDVTEIERRERHVHVLDRLLRHNLRNDLGIIIGRAENVLGLSDDDEIRAETTKLLEAARGLVELSETAKQIRRLIEAPTEERSPVPVGPLLADLIEGAREEYPRASFEADHVADDLAVLATPHLRVAIEELIENAVLHGSSSPMVALRVEQVDSVPDQWVDLLVVDDGPGIPESERDAVTGEQDITQLHHGSGLGLWLVRWAVESLGGELSFERREGETVVRLRLRRTTLSE